MDLLIDKTQVSEYFQIATGRASAEFDKYIKQVQLFELKKLMPEHFYSDLLKNKDAENYQSLINGCAYTYEGYEYEHEGLKAVIAHYVYGLYIFKSNIQDTSFGFVTKTSGQSEAVDYKERKDWYYEHRSQAGELWLEVQKYIERNIESFPKWKQPVENTHSGFKTKIIQ